MFHPSCVLFNRRWTRMFTNPWTKTRAKSALNNLARIRRVEEVLRQPYYTIIADNEYQDPKYKLDQEADLSPLPKR